MENHQHPHAETLDQDDRDRSNVLLEDTAVSTRRKNIEIKPHDIRKCENEGNYGVCASFFPHSVPDVAKLQKLSFHCSLYLYEEPDDQREHYDNLDKEQPTQWGIE